MLVGLSKYNLSAAEKKRIATLVVGNYMFLLADPGSLPATYSSKNYIQLFHLVSHTLVCNIAQHDCPIVYTSEGFTQFTGYTSAEITGKNCRFLQGKDTTKESVDKVREAMRVKKPTAVSLVNYKKDGTKFYNSFFIAPVYDATNNFVLYLG